MVRYILHSPGLASCRRRPLNSNVRPHNPQPMTTVAITVVYDLREYMSIVRDFGLWHQSTEGGKRNWHPKNRGLVHHVVHAATIYLIAPPIFLMKKRAVGACEFNIDRNRIQRHSKNENIELPWKDVLRVHRLTQAYLVEKDGGAMPLPYRAFTGSQQQSFEAILKANTVSTVDTR